MQDPQVITKRHSTNAFHVVEFSYVINTVGCYATQPRTTTPFYFTILLDRKLGFESIYLGYINKKADLRKGSHSPSSTTQTSNQLSASTAC